MAKKKDIKNLEQQQDELLEHFENPVKLKHIKDKKLSHEQRLEMLNCAYDVNLIKFVFKSLMDENKGILANSTTLERARIELESLNETRTQAHDNEIVVRFAK